MNASSQLRHLYEQWLVLTEQEGRAIRAADWPRVQTCQSQKHRLQADIQKAADELDHDTPVPGENRARIESEFRPIVEELIARERENDRELAAQRRTAQAHSTELHQATRQLRQIHHAYAPVSPPLWQSYS